MRACCLLLLRGGGRCGRRRRGDDRAGLNIQRHAEPDHPGENALAYGQLTGPESRRREDHAARQGRPRHHLQRRVQHDDRHERLLQVRLPAGSCHHRSLYVSVPGGNRSRTVHERVAAALTLEASAATGNTSHALAFSGQVVPAGVHSGEHVSLQQATGSSGSWKTIGQGAIAASSSYAISHDFHTPGAYECASRSPATRKARGRGLIRSRSSSSKPSTSVHHLHEQPRDRRRPNGDHLRRLRARARPRQPLAGESVTLWGHAHGAPSRRSPRPRQATTAATASPRRRLTTAPTRCERRPGEQHSSMRLFMRWSR